VPTGVHLNNPRELLFEAAERVLARDGASALTSRAVTEEAGVAKGVLHRHFADFDAFLAELILDRTAGLDEVARALHDAAGDGSVVDHLVTAMTALFTPLVVAVPALVIIRDGLRTRLRAHGAARLPLIAEGTAMVTTYLAEEQRLGRLDSFADPAALAPTLIGSLHLCFTDREGGPPAGPAIRAVVATVVPGAP
jgi:AcrR family transcriptional regulator